MKLIAALFLIVSGLCAQGVSDVQSSVTLATAPLTAVFTLTGVNGTVCSLFAVGGSTIATAGNCKTSDGKTTVTMPRIASTSNAIAIFTWGYGEILCIGAVNGTVTPIPANMWMGLPYGALSNGVGLSCSTGTGGVVSNYSIGWPNAL